MFVCVIIITHVLRLYYTIFYQEPRSEPHQRGHLGGEQKHRFDVARKVRTLFPNDETPNLVCLFLAFPHFLSCFPIFFSYFFYGAHVFFSCSSHRSFGRTSWFYWYFCEGFQKVMLLWRCWPVLSFHLILHFAAIFEFGFSFKSLENDLRSKSCNTISRKRY